MERTGPDTYRLSSGREISAHHGLIGLAHQTGERVYSRTPWGAPNFGRFELAEGYDGHLSDVEEWTLVERQELADFMIAQWTAFKAPTSVYELFDKRNCWLKPEP